MLAFGDREATVHECGQREARMSTTVLVITNRFYRDLRKALEATAVRAVVVETLTQTFRLLRRGVTAP